MSTVHRGIVAFAFVALTTVGRVQPDPPQAPYEDLAIDLLRRYLQIDTTVPPGNEKRAAQFFKEIFDREGIPAEIDEFEPGRANIMATLKGRGKKRPLVLLNHMDVVPVDLDRWSVPPFSGLLRDGLIYGRGAQDMKAEGILHLLALVRLKREGVSLSRDVIFLGTADEEVGFAGASRALGRPGWSEVLRAAEYVIAEGGENVPDSEGQTVFGVETAQKVPLWLTLRAEGTPGHGSRPLPDAALNRLVRALERIRRHETQVKVLPAVTRYLKDQASRVPEPQATWYRDAERAVLDPAVAKALGDDRELGALVRNTIAMTVVRAGYKTNVIPGIAEAELDVRLLPGEDPAAFLDELKRVIDDPTLQILPAQGVNRAVESSPDTELFHVIERVLGRHAPGALVTTKMATGATESALFRPLGITAYGFTPLEATAEEIASTHGDDERVSEATVRRSTGIFYEVVREIAR